MSKAVRAVADPEGPWLEPSANGPVSVAGIDIREGWLAGLTDEDAEAFGLVVAEIAEPATSPPEGQVFAGWQLDEDQRPALADVDGVPTRVPTYEAVPLPPEVPMYKVRKYLIREGLKAAVEAHLDGLEGTEGEEAREDWEYAPNLVVNSPLALGAKTALGLTDEQYAAMIRAANALA